MNRSFFPSLISCLALATFAVAADTANIADTLRAAGPDAARRAAPATTAAIRALGTDATPRKIAGIVFLAARTVPESVLDIVHAAVLASPDDAAPEIVAAAISAVPDPWKQVRYRRRGSVARHGERDFKGEPDYKDSGPESQMTLAEAIVMSAFDARAGLDLRGLQVAANGAIVSSPAYLLALIHDPKGISGVGDVGNNNYSNEPFRPPVKPEPKPVSR